MKVYKAINDVQSDLSKIGISKEGKNQQQGYSFRGIDQVYGTLSSLLSKHKLCILPRVISRTEREGQTKSGGIMLYVVVEVEFDFVSCEDGTKHTVKTFGESCDTSDKATNKALSAAYKYACIQSFCIPLEGDEDADSFSPEPVKNIAQEKKQYPAKKQFAGPDGLGNIVIPMGSVKVKGKKINEIPLDDLKGIANWMESKNQNGEFEELLRHIDSYLDKQEADAKLQQEHGAL